MPFIKSYYINKIKLTNVPIKSNNFDKFELLIIRNYNQLNKLREENYRFGEWNLKYINNQLLNNCIAISFFKDKTGISKSISGIITLISFLRQ